MDSGIFPIVRPEEEQEQVLGRGSFGDFWYPIGYAKTVKCTMLE